MFRTVQKGSFMHSQILETLLQMARQLGIALAFACETNYSQQPIEMEAGEYSPSCPSDNEEPAGEAAFTVSSQPMSVPMSPSMALVEQPCEAPERIAPPPPAIACEFHRHRRGRGWSLSEPCEACLQLAMEVDIG